jgi:CheY-like chemotaxis protein
MTHTPIVFVVDDEERIATTLAAIRNNSGFKAWAFISPLQALEALNGVNPDLVLSDVVMPEMTGIELAIRFQTLCPSCKVVLFSGQVETYDLLSDARKHGYDFEILAKPVHPQDLLDKLRNTHVGAVQ